MNLYNITTDDVCLRITNFDNDLNVIKSYELSNLNRNGVWECNCPLYYKPTCKHRQMLQIFQEAKRVDTEWFYNVKEGTWRVA